MRKVLLSLFLLFALNFISSAQKYEGSITVGGTAIGALLSTSHGVRLNNEYIGLGVEAGADFLLFVGEEWHAVYADYRHNFPFKNKRSSFFLEAAPGVSYFSFWTIADNNNSEDPNKHSEKKTTFYTKVALGIDWSFKKCGLRLGLQDEVFAPTSSNTFIPSLTLSFYW